MGHDQSTFEVPRCPALLQQGARKTSAIVLRLQVSADQQTTVNAASARCFHLLVPGDADGGFIDKAGKETHSILTQFFLGIMILSL